jgi:hypothetical protein
MCSSCIQPTAVFSNFFMLVSCLAYSSTLKMEATHSTKTSVDFQQTMLHYIQEIELFRSTHCFNVVGTILLLIYSFFPEYEQVSVKH